MTMPKCCVNKCKNNTLSVSKRQGVSYFRFPVNEIIKEKWRKIIAQERKDEFFQPNISNVVCSDHFLDSEMYYTKAGKRKITKNAVPIKVMQQETITIEIETTRQQSTSNFTFQPINTGQSRPETQVIKEEPKTNDIVILNEDEMIQQSIISTGQSESHEVMGTELISDDDISSTSSDNKITSNFKIGTPETEYYKRKLLDCQRKLDSKTKEVNNLKKRNKRLVQKNASLKFVLQTLKKKIPRC